MAEVRPAVHRRDADAVAGVSESPCLGDMVSLSRRDQVGSGVAASDRVEARLPGAHAVRSGRQDGRRDGVHPLEGRDLLQESDGDVDGHDAQAGPRRRNGPNRRRHTVRAEVIAEHVHVIREDGDSERAAAEPSGLLDGRRQLVPIRVRLSCAVEELLHRGVHGRRRRRRISSDLRRRSTGPSQIHRGPCRARDDGQQSRSDHEDSQRDGPRASNEQIHQDSTRRAIVEQKPGRGSLSRRSPNCVANQGNAI